MGLMIQASFLDAIPCEFPRCHKQKTRPISFNVCGIFPHTLIPYYIKRRYILVHVAMRPRCSLRFNRPNIVTWRTCPTYTQVGPAKTNGSAKAWERMRQEVGVRRGRYKHHQSVVWFDTAVGIYHMSVQIIKRTYFHITLCSAFSLGC